MLCMGQSHRPYRPSLQAACCLQVIAPMPNTQSHLLRIVSTLEKDYMKSAPPSSLLDLEQYAEGTSSQLLYLQVERSPFWNWRVAYVIPFCLGFQVQADSLCWLYVLSARNPFM